MVSMGVLFSLAVGLLGVVFIILIGVLGWLGMRLFAKLDALTESWQKVVLEMHERISDIDSRVLVIEERCDMQHPMRRSLDKKG